jgi:hypothetical protein
MRKANAAAPGVLSITQHQCRGCLPLDALISPHADYTMHMFWRTVTLCAQ